MGIKVRTNDVRQAGERARARHLRRAAGAWLARRAGDRDRGRRDRRSRRLPGSTRSADRRGGPSSSTRELPPFATPPARRSTSCARVTSTAEGKLEALAQGGSRVAPERRRDPARPRRVDPLPRPEGAEGHDQPQRRARDRSSCAARCPNAGCGTSSRAKPRRSRASGASRTCSTCRAKPATSSHPPDGRGDELAEDLLPAGRSRGGCARGQARDARPRPASSGGPRAARSRAGAPRRRTRRTAAHPASALRS